MKAYNRSFLESGSKYTRFEVDINSEMPLVEKFWKFQARYPAKKISQTEGGADVNEILVSRD